MIEPANPRWWGAKLDRQADDLPALDAMMASLPMFGGRIYWPNGVAWISDTWEITRSVSLVGEGGAVSVESGLEVAPGKPALVVSAGGTWIGHLDLTSRILFNDQVHGPTGYGVGQIMFAVGAPVRAGDCYVDGVNDDVFYRAQNAGTFGAVAPAWAAVIGDVLTDNGITWVTEAFPLLRQANQLYAEGERIFALDDNRNYYECVAAGTSADLQPIAPELRSFDEIVGITLRLPFADYAGAALEWMPTFAPGVYIRGPQGVMSNVHVTVFTNAGVHAAGLHEVDVNFANNIRLQDLHIDICGLGVFCGGDNCNGWRIDRVQSILLGRHVPNPTTPGNAGYVFEERTLGGIASNLYYEESNGVAVLKTGNGQATFAGCQDEGSTLSYFGGGLSTLLGGTLVATANSNVTQVAALCRNLSEETPSGPNTLRARLKTQAGLFAFESSDDNGNEYAFKYGFNTPPGFWGLQAGPNGIKNAFSLSTTVTELDPCPGWLSFDLGYLEGDEQAAPGSLRFYGSSAGMISERLRESLRLPGDRFRDALRSYLITSTGYRAKPWVGEVPPNPPPTASVRDATLGIPATTVEPTTYGRAPVAGQNVFYCVQSGELDVAEPNWAGVPPIVDGTAEWEVLGTTPSMVVTYGPGGGQFYQDVTAAGPFALADEEAVNEFLHFDGNPGAARSATVPAPANNQEAYRRVVRNTSDGDLTIGTGVGATVTIGANKTAMVGFDGAGAFQITAEL